MLRSSLARRRRSWWKLEFTSSTASPSFSAGTQLPLKGKPCLTKKSIFSMILLRYERLTAFCFFMLSGTSSRQHHDVISRVNPYSACESVTAHVMETHPSCLHYRLSSWYSHDLRRHRLTCCIHNLTNLLPFANLVVMDRATF